jgi:hypothetical protein
MAVLETKLDAAEKYNDKILTTVYWSIGALATVILFVLGLNLFNIYRNTEGLKRELKTSLHKEVITEVSKSAKQEVEKIIASELSNINEMKSNLTEMKFNFQKMEVDKWKSDKVYQNVLSSSLDLLDTAKEMSSNYNILISLDYIKFAITHLNAVGDDGRRTEYLKLLDRLNIMSEQFPIETEAIIKLVKIKRAN